MSHDVSLSGFGCGSGPVVEVEDIAVNGIWLHEPYQMMDFKATTSVSKTLLGMPASLVFA